MLAHDPDAVKDASLDRHVMKRAWEFARPFRPMIWAFVATIVVRALLQLVPPLLFARIIDDGIVGGDRGVINVLSAIVVASAVVEAALALAERWFSARVGEGLIYRLRTALFDHVQRMPLAFFTHTQTGALISRLNNDVIGAQRAVTGTLGQVVSNVVVVTSTVMAMLVLDWRLTLLALVLLPLFVVPAKRVGRRLQKLTREQMDLNAEMNNTMTERFSVGGAQLVKLFGRHDRELEEFEDRAGRVRDMGIKSALYGRTFFIALGLVGSIGTALIYWVGGLMAVSGSIAPGTLVALALLVARIYQPLTALTSARVDIMTAMVSFERVFEVLDSPRAIDDKPGAYDLVDPRGEVAMEGVRFTYPTSGSAALAGNASSTPNAEVLHGVDLEVPAGSMLALVGPSGAGKSTIASLLNRLYDVTTGRVTVDGHDIRNLTQQSLRAAIGVVSQDPHLFHDTVAANLRYARPDASDSDLEQACRAARIHEVITALPDGYRTVVGERGYRLSGGEKQRLSIARLLLKDPTIVILDEATSHLDSENEALIQQALEHVLSGRTSIVIAHRLSTVRSADNIVVLESGRVVESGTHDELVSSGGLYAELHRTLLTGRSAASTPAS